MQTYVFFKFTYPSKDWKKCKEDSSVNVGTREAKSYFLCLAPSYAHVDESDEIEKGPQPREGHVEDHVMLSGLDRGHLLKEPFSCNAIFSSNVIQ